MVRSLVFKGLVAVVLGLAFSWAKPVQAMNPVQPPAISYVDLTWIASGRCVKRPVRGVAIYDAMTRGPSRMSDVELLQHAATRLGYGLSSLGPLVPNKANDCTTVFIAEEIARQISVLGVNEDNPLLMETRRGLLPLTMFRRNAINQAIVDFKAQDPSGASYGSLWWEAWLQVAGLMTFREMVGTQRVLDGKLYDHQIALEEVMAEFWFNHFNVAAGKPTQYIYGSNSYPEALRFALGGTFASLLKTAMQQPAMVVYLDNQNNLYDPTTGSAGNQNLARELLELHTFGVGPRDPGASASTGPYGQQDIEELAKILAGWHAYHHGHDVPDSEFGFVYHDQLDADLPVTFLGVPYPATGKARVEAVLAALAAHAQTRSAVCTKLSRLFYAPSLVGSASDACQAVWGTGGDLKAMLLTLLSREQFWARSNYRNVYRTPIEIVVSAMRQMGANIVDAAYATHAEGRTASPFDPATMTPSSYLAAIEALKASRTAAFISGPNRRIENLLGTQRMNVAPPTGYSLDGARYFSTGYIDTVSRTALELAGLFEQMNPASRRDFVSVQYTQPLIWDDIEANGRNFAMQKYVGERLGMGDVLSIHRPVVLSRSPYVFPPSHQTILSAVAANQSYWAYWEATPSNKVLEKAWAGVALGNVQQLRK